MGLKKAENQVKLLLQDTIIALCRNTLNYCAEVTVEGLLGITLDSDEIFLVSLNETFNNPNVAKKEKANLKRSKDTADGSGSESHSDQSDDESGPSKRKKKRHRKKKKKRDESGESGDESASSDNQENDTAKAHPTAHDESQDNDDAPGQRPTPADTRQQGNGTRNRDPDGNDRHSQDEDEEDLQKIKIKEEADDDDDEDLVFVKEEIGDSSLHHNQYSSYSNEQMYLPHHGMQGGLVMPGQPGTSTGQYSQQDYMGDMSNMSNISQGSDSQQMMGFSPGQQNISFSGASPMAGPSSSSGDDGKMCYLCHKMFKYNYNLQLHMRVHTGEKPYACHLCDYKGNQKIHLQKHLKHCHRS